MTATEPRFAHGRPTLSIDLEALTANYRLLQAQAPGAELAGVVKADGYGLGAIPVTRALIAAGCRTFFVAHLDEALALRAAFPAIALAVLNGVYPGSEEEFAQQRLSPVLNTPGEVARYAAFARTRDTRLPAILHLDTGMTRLGLNTRQAETVLQAWPATLDLDLVMSHLACGEKPDHPLTSAQRQRFVTRTDGIAESTRRSLANSAGVFLGAAYQFDLCRPGIALYGGNPTEQAENPMRAVIRLDAPILQTHDVADDATIGYGATYPLARDGRAVTVALGYADGLLRAGSNRARARLAGYDLPFAGRVSMDLITLDASHVPANILAVAEHVTFFDEVNTIDTYAQHAGTIAYEVLTRLGARFTRRHTGVLGA